VVANYLRRKGELNDTIVVPLDAHQRLFLDAKNSAVTHSSSRCDMLLVRPIKQRLFIDFVEVKYRSGDDVVSASLLDQMADQTQITDNAVRGLYFSDPPRLDAPILRCQLAAILRFYAERAYRHGRMGSEQKYIELLDNIGRVEMGLTRMTPRHRGFIVNLNGRPHKPIKRDDITVQVLTGIEIDRDTDFVRNSNVAETTEPVSVSPDVDAPAPMEPDGNSAIVEQLNTAEDGGNESKLRTVTEVSPKEDKVSPLTIPDPETEDTNKEPMTVGEDDFEERNQSAYINSQHEIVMPLGEDDDSGQPVSWVGAVKGSPHLFIMGIPGQGKSWSVLRLISEASRLDVPSLILDFHGQFATPESPFTKSVKPTILSVAEGLPFSPFEISATVSGASNSWKMNAFQVSEILQYVCDLGEMQRDLVYEAIHDSYMEAGYDDPSQTDAQPPSMASVYKHLKELEQERRGAKNTVARVRPLFEFGLFQDTAENIDFASLYTNTSIIDLHGVSMETMQIAAGAFVLRKVYKDMFTWGESDRLRLLVVLDEAHRLAKDITLPKLMKEGRKYGIAIIVASQTMNDFHSEVLQNAGTKVLFRTNFPQSKRVIGCVKPPHYIADLSTTLENLAVGRALVQTPDMSSCAVVSMYPYQP
ncbi:MAG: DUF87 domain-containing protein, partial [Armatimonadetes bacterium]|nr:DUF87 domain-containing protein [Armatimonadota bacterium]